MTAHKHLKELVRDRMRKTGESYAAARRQIVRQAPPGPGEPNAPSTAFHFPGSIPATTALRSLLTHAGIRSPRTGQPLSEAMLFGIAGGIGIGVFSFFYEKENFASFFVAGRHRWQDDEAYLKEACKRLGVETVVQESGGAKAAEKQLRETLANGPCIAWVDSANLPHRAMPQMWSGGGYHVITVYSIDDESNTALIGDLTDTPISISLPALAKARERIKKQKNRLLAVAGVGGKGSGFGVQGSGSGTHHSSLTSHFSLDEAIKAGLRACYEGLTGVGGMKQAQSNFSLECLKVWGARMHGSRDRERWEHVFAPPRLASGLGMMSDFIEHYGTGGGLCRPIFSEFLGEAVEVTGDVRLADLSQRYAELGRNWSDLARHALPEDVPMFRETRELQARRAELIAAGAPPEEVRAIWDRLEAISRSARESFPLSDAECAALRASLQPRIMSLYEEEKAAHAAMGELLAD